MARLLIIGASLALLLTTAQAQVMNRDTLVCTLVVNDVRVSWPSGILSREECAAMRDELETKDETSAEIVCHCTVGDRA